MRFDPKFCAMRSDSEEKLGTEQSRQQQAQTEGRERRAVTELLGHSVRHVHPQVANPGDEVVKKRPGQAQRDQLEEPSRQDAQASREDAGELAVGDLGSDAGVEHPDDERHQQEHADTTDAVQDRHDARRRQAIADDLADVDIAKRRARLGGFSHLQLSC